MTDPATPSRPHPTTRFIRQELAQQINFSSCHLLADFFKTNIGPFGSLKMFESDSSETSLTKDGGELLARLTVIHPTALFLSRAGHSQETAFRDGVSSMITFIDAILRQCEFKISEGIHPRVLVNGLEEAPPFNIVRVWPFPRERREPLKKITCYRRRAQKVTFQWQIPSLTQSGASMGKGRSILIE
jgi:hypothetical protein